MIKSKTRVLVLGSSGMLGNAIFKLFLGDSNFVTYGSVRSSSNVKFSEDAKKSLVCIDNLFDDERLMTILSSVRPNVVINCIGIVKQLKESEDPLLVIPINSLLPHKLAKFCDLIGARLIHISTDCVYSGNKGLYTESDMSDAIDMYGRTKYIGEVDYLNSVTLRTSIIGHEPNSQSRSLVDWFISQRNPVSGYVNAIFSGLPCVELAMIIRDFVLPSNELHGLFHISSEPINKFELLKLIAQVYDLDTHIYPDRSLCINRSLDSSKFSNATGYRPKKWVDLINQMHTFQVGSPF
jgi:dTDP-4-dehydrorhamnose reductase